MKNDPVVTTRMDLPEVDVFGESDIDVKKEFIDGSSYTNDFPEQSATVNTTAAMELSLKHNNDAKKCSFTWNGFQQAKAPRLTCTGRITRVPSRYLDTDSDSGDGSNAAKAVVSRLKIKRRRKSSSSNKKQPLVNGYKEHGAFSLDMGGIHSDSIICNLKTEKIETRLGNLECSEVFDEIASPVSNDNISPFKHEREALSPCQANYTSTWSENTPESFENVKVNGSFSQSCHLRLGNGVKPSKMYCSPTSEAAPVDISSENKGETRFASSNFATGQTLQELSCSKQTPSDFELQSCVQPEGMSISASLKKKQPSCVGDDSSTNSNNFVSVGEISKQTNVSCTCLKPNDSNETQEPCCNGSLECVSEAHSCVCSLCAEVGHEGENCKRNGCTKQLEGDADFLLSVTCLENGEKTLKDQLIDDGNSTVVCKDDNIKSQGLNCFRNFKMSRIGTYNARKRKQMRRTDRAVNNNTSNNSGLNCNQKLDQVKRKSTNKKATTRKTAQVHKTKLKQKNNIKKSVQKSAKPAKASEDTADELDQVLGMRRNAKGDYEFLVQWSNGTSCWVSSKQVVSNKQNGLLRQYLMENEQDVSVVNRVSFEAYCCDSLSLDQCQAVPVNKIFQKTKEVLKKQPKPIVEKPVPIPTKKAEVMVENIGDHCYITLNRETCKRKLTCLNIVNEFITALEDASVSECRLVVIRGLGSRVFSGLDIDSIHKVGVEDSGNMVLQKTRYLVQTLCNYQKPLVGLISRPAQGLGALLLSLFDMICDEETWKEEGFVANSRESCDSVDKYCLPRVVGHSVPCEEILMGKNCAELTESVSGLVSDAMFDQTDSSIMMGTLKEIEATIGKLGKKTNSMVDISEGEILKMTLKQMTNVVNNTVCVEVDKSLLEEKRELLNDTCFAENSFNLSSSSEPADRYMRELESKILEEKQLVQKYVDEISNIWNTPSFVLKEERS